MRIKQATLIGCLLIMCIVPLISKPLALGAASYQSKTPFPKKIHSCSEIKKLYPELEKLSRDELRKYLFEMFIGRYNSNPMENYTHIKYYLCRFPKDKSEQANYWKKWVAAFEKKLKDIDD